MIRFCRSLKKSEIWIGFFLRANRYFALLLTKNEQFARKTKERIPNPGVHSNPSIHIKTNLKIQKSSLDETRCSGPVHQSAEDQAGAAEAVLGDYVRPGAGQAHRHGHPLPPPLNTHRGLLPVNLPKVTGQQK